MQFSNLALSRRLERAEGFACAESAEARRRLFPSSGAEWIECAGTYAVFNGVNSPITQTFGLGLFEELTPTALDTIESFFFDRGTDVIHEVSPFAGVAALDLLCAREYRPIEISSVMYRPVETPPAAKQQQPIRASYKCGRSTSVDRYQCQRLEFRTAGAFGLRPRIRLRSPRLASTTFALSPNWTENPVLPARYGSMKALRCLAARRLFPEMRRRGLQGALLQERMRYAAKQGCDLAMMVAEAGSESQRNTERKGFQIAYTRLKWRKPYRVPSTI